VEIFEKNAGKGENCGEKKKKPPTPLRGISGQKPPRPQRFLKIFRGVFKKTLSELPGGKAGDGGGKKLGFFFFRVWG